jgi:hypothetical protein
MDLWSEILRSMDPPQAGSLAYTNVYHRRIGKVAGDSYPVRLNIHLGEVEGEVALNMAHRVANRINAVVYLVAEPEFDPSAPQGKKVRCL